MSSILRFAAVVALMSVSQVVLADDDQALVGWYDLEGTRARVTWRPAGGLYLIALDPQHTATEGGPSLWVLEPGSLAGEWVWKGTDRHARFEMVEGVAAALTWSDSAGRKGRAPRLAEEPYRQQLVLFESQGLHLEGTVLIPNGDGPFPAVALIQGSGTSGRSNLWAWSFADALAQRGIAALVPDKRGSGRSEGDWMQADFFDLAADAASSWQALREVEGVDPERVGFVGLSQGGWVAPLATEITGAAFCASLVAAAVKPSEQVIHEMTQSFYAAGLDRTEVRSLVEALRSLLSFVATGRGWDRIERRRGELLAGPTAAFAEELLPPSPESPVVAFWRGIYDFDPLAAWTRLEVPRLLILGAEDEDDNTPVGESLRRLGSVFAADPSTDIELVVFPGIGHVLGDSRTGWISPRIHDHLASWVHWNAPAGKGPQAQDAASLPAPAEPNEVSEAPHASDAEHERTRRLTKPTGRL